MIGQYERAIEDLSEAVRLAPENAIVHLNRGNVYARLGFKEQAVGDYETVTRLDPRLIAFYGGAAKLLEDMGRNNLAIRDEKKLALQSDPAELELHLEQGNALRSQGDWKGAIAEFDRVIERDPQRAEAYVARGWARFCAGEAGAQTDARSFLNLKGWRDRLSPYMALLGFLGSRRDGKENDARTFLDEAISSSAQTTWPVPVLAFPAARYFGRCPARSRRERHPEDRGAHIHRPRAAAARRPQESSRASDLGSRKGRIPLDRHRPGEGHARAARPSARGSFPDDRSDAESLKRSRPPWLLAETGRCVAAGFAPDGDDIGMPRVGNLDEARRGRKGRGKATNLAGS